MSNFKKLNLNPTILTTLEKKGYSNPTPIQSEAIPNLLNKKDFLGIAQTGTGKTAAFSLPILDLLSQNKKTVKPNQIRSLILTPTRELAIQIGENIALYGKGLGLNHCVIFGGVNEFHQIKALKNGQDIVIATPGRLLDLANQGHIRFSQVEIFVLDEADRMLDMGFIHDVKKIISKLPEERQSLLFSATMPETISSLANSILKNPVKVEITPQSTTVERINQKVYLVDKSNKPALLLDVLSKPDVVAALVFSKTKHGANKVVLHLEKYGVKVAAIHGNKSQSAREKALKSLREGKINVLIATDIEARGIDVSSISHVINYDIPNDPESYVHRIGRTARAGREGIAISFCDYGENLQLRAVEKAIRMKIPVDNSHPFHGKAANPEHSDGKLLSRNKNNNFEKKEVVNGNSDKNEKRRPFGDSDRKPSRFSTSRNSDSRFQKSDSSKQIRSQRDRFGKENRSEESEPLAKKILRKFGFSKFGKDSAISEVDNKNRGFKKSGMNNRSGSFRNSNSEDSKDGNRSKSRTPGNRTSNQKSSSFKFNNKSNKKSFGRGRNSY